MELTTSNKTKKLLVNYIYSLSKDIYEDKNEIQQNILNSTKDNPVSTSWIKIQAESIEARAKAIIDICDTLNQIDKRQYDDLTDDDTLKARELVTNSLKVYFN